MAPFNYNHHHVLFTETPETKEITALETKMLEMQRQICDNQNYYKSIRDTIKTKIDYQSQAATLVNSYEKINEEKEKEETKKHMIEKKVERK